VRAHQHEIELAAGGGLGNQFTGRADLQQHLRIDAVAGEELHHRAGDLRAFLGVVGVGDLGAHGRARPRGQRGLDGDHAETVAVGAEQLVVGGQVAEHLLGVGTAIDGEQDLHEGSPWGLVTHRV